LILVITPNNDIIFSQLPFPKGRMSNIPTRALARRYYFELVPCAA
jgi:hypothetical protein